MSVLRRLRKETRDLHDRLEAVVDVERRTADTGCYRGLLTALRSVYAPLERALEACPGTTDVLADWPRGARPLGRTRTSLRSPYDRPTTPPSPP